MKSVFAIAAASLAISTSAVELATETGMPGWFENYSGQIFDYYIDYHGAGKVSVDWIKRRYTAPSWDANGWEGQDTNNDGYIDKAEWNVYYCKSNSYCDK